MASAETCAVDLQEVVVIAPRAVQDLVRLRVIELANSRAVSCNSRVDKIGWKYYF